MWWGLLVAISWKLRVESIWSSVTFALLDPTVPKAHLSSRLFVKCIKKFLILL